MITPQNEFETIPVFSSLAGCSLGTMTDRETTCELLKILGTTTQQDTAKYWEAIARLTDSESPEFYDLQETIIDLLNNYAPLPPYCSIELKDGEWMVTPYIDDDLPRVDDIPDNHGDDELLLVNDHGNVSLLIWNESKREYSSVWSMV